MLAIAGGKPGTEWTGVKRQKPPEKSISSYPQGYPEEAGFLERGLTDRARSVPSSELFSCLAPHSFNQIQRKNLVKSKNKSRAWEE